jgi:hypothetical protein
MELRKDTVNTVYLEGADTWSVTATATLNGEPLGSLIMGRTGNRFSATLPYIPSEGEVEVAWTISGLAATPTTRTDYYEVVTPYLTASEIMRDCEIDDVEEAARIESVVRLTINAHTGQSFGRRHATYSVKGTGEKTLALPARLISLTTPGPYEITGDGWYLQLPVMAVPPVRADYYGLHMHKGGVIHNPYGVDPSRFLYGAVYTIEGEWGWKVIPPEIRESARLLANDVASGDNVYRDRYLTSMTAADWRIQFHSGAFAKTGNARVDQLLSNFVLNRGWTVI